MFTEAFLNGDGSFPQNINKTQKLSQAYLDAFREKAESGQPYEEVEIDPVTVNMFIMQVLTGITSFIKITPVQSDNNMTITGSGEKTTYLLSGRYMTQNGLFSYNTDDYNM